MVKEDSSDYKKVRNRWFFKEPLTEWFFVEPKMVLLWHRLKGLLKHLYFQPLIDMRKEIIEKCSADSVPLFKTEEALGKRRREKVKRHSTDVGETLFLEMH